MFNDTLRYNLTIGSQDASDEELEQVIRTSRVNEFFDELSDGYETQLGDDGVRLSGGKRQRVALARALLKDADVLVLDEVTRDLDSNLEQSVQAAIESLEREYAMVGIAHQLSTVKNADRIYMVDDGSIIETGTHSELLETGGQYAELYAIQTKSG
jgi:subfamily B ATP-binding cassette protein MsbA